MISLSRNSQARVNDRVVGGFSILSIDVTYFLLALEQVGDLDMGTLALIESAWQSSMAAARMFGWVVVLMTGQRLYFEMEVADVQDEWRPDLEVTRLNEAADLKTRRLSLLKA